MHPAIELILARMESHPEEFQHVANAQSILGSHSLYKQYRWSGIIEELSTRAEKEEFKLVEEKLKAIQMDCIHSAIMQELCNPSEKEPEQGYLFHPNAKPTKLITSKEMSENALKILNSTLNCNTTVGKV